MIAAAILAAGLSTRFPGNKLLYEWSGKPVVKWTLENALKSRVDRVLIVVGHQSEQVLGVLKDVCCFDVVYNKEYWRGMSSSVKVAANYVLKHYSSIDALMFTPGDCAWIPPEAYNALIEEHARGEYLILVAGYMGVKGHPILFDSKIIPEITSVSEETRGLKGVVKKYWWSIRVVDTIYPGVVLDIDTYNDLNRVKYFLKK